MQFFTGLNEGSKILTLELIVMSAITSRTHQQGSSR